MNQTIKEYLTSLQPIIQRLVAGQIKNKKIHLTIGNTSCDLDSFVCASTVSWFKSHMSKRDQKNVDTLYLPGLSINQSEFSLRTEVTFICEKISLFNPSSSFVFLDSFKNVELTTISELEICLVDHHFLDLKWGKNLDPCITEIIDHHQKSKPYPPNCIVNNVMVGSCSTLITKLITSEVDKLPDDVNLLLLSAVLVDTGNLSKALGKATKLDIEMIQILNDGLPNDQNPNEIYQECDAAKYNVSKLSTKQLLIKDAKYVHFGQFEHHKCVVSSMHLSLESLKNRDNVYTDISQWCTENESVLWVGILPVKATKNGSFKPIMLFSKDLNLLDKMSVHLLEDNSLQMERSLDLNVNDFILLHMNNIKASRKQVLPSICNYLKTV